MPCLPNVMREAMSTRISLQACRIPELPMQSAMRMSPRFRLQDHSSNIPLTWPRSFMPTNQEQRNLIARMKLIPVQALIDQKKLLLIDDSIVRGTQLRETTEFLYQSGAKEVHVRPACPPLLYGCKFLNFSRSKSELDLITRRIILEKKGRKCRESTGRVCRSDQRPLRVHVPGNLPPSEFHQPQVSPSGRSGRVDRTAEMQNVYLLL